MSKNWRLTFFYNEKYVPPYENMNATHKLNSIQTNLNSTHYRIQHKKKIESEKMVTRMEKCCRS